MISENRQNPRFEDIGRVEASDICSLPGVLDDISTNGFGAHFPIFVDIDMDDDYKITIRPTALSDYAGRTFLLIGHPQWKIDGEGGSRIGFKLLRSPDTPKYNEYVDTLAQKSLDFDAIMEPISV